MNPKPAAVQYNNWRQANAPPLDMRAPPLVSVLIPYYQTHRAELRLTLAALECQTYPRDMFEVIIVDDGSEPPLTLPELSPLNIRVVRQERRGFGRARARNAGARVAAHDILLFLDSDMLVEKDWIAAHAQWHRAFSDALTLGNRAFVSVDDIDADTIRRRQGSLAELFSDRPSDISWVQDILDKTDSLQSKSDDIFVVVVGANFGIRKDFYELVGGCDESFTHWGLEDTELGYRAYIRGGLLVPVQDAFGRHQGRWNEDRDAKRRSAQSWSGKVANLIAHPSFRPDKPGRIYAVPQYVVTIDAAHSPVDRVVRAVERILADRVHDLVVRIQTGAIDDSEGLERLRDEFGPDPRVRLASAHSALDEFPASPFHISLPAAVFAKDLVYRLRFYLGDAVEAAANLPDGSAVSITRVWALNRARRAGKSVSDFGETRTISANALNIKPAGAEVALLPPSALARARERLRAVQSTADAWLFAKWAAGAVWRRAAGKSIGKSKRAS